AYVDGEITDPSKITEIKNLIETDKKLNIDYLVQVQTKKLVLDKLEINPAPEEVKRKIIRKIKPTRNFLKKLF
ncbi:MAG TPA: hypothetical protein VLN45_11510, partial [Ignavibacteriaceae bacterium]|nr:hypothetical protein [Ignavibacteriaceae bacterium]